MNFRRVLSIILCTSLFGVFVPQQQIFAAPLDGILKQFSEPIDAFSVRLSNNLTNFRYQFLQKGEWSKTFTYENDGDVLAGEESELVMLPEGVSALLIDGVQHASDIHGITVSKEPIRYSVSARKIGTSGPTILSRDEWGADASYMFKVPVNEKAPTDEVKGDNGSAGGTTVNQRADECAAAQAVYPLEFQTQNTLRTNAQGQKYLWPQSYSKQVKLLVVHHSALKVAGDPRPAVERVRAIYKYHAVSKEWGDIGYHFIVDEAGQIYEGRAGGKGVVGGHAYCNNVGTIGVVLLGNFENEEPSQSQIKSLQWLLKDLSSEYGIDLQKSVQFHGKTFVSPIVGHKDVLSTLCPGYFLAGVLSQIRSNILEGKLNGTVVFPVKPTSGQSSSKGSTAVKSENIGMQEGIAFSGRTSIAINPGGKQRISLSYTAGDDGAYQGKRIADVSLSHPDITLWVDDGIDQIAITKGLLLPFDLPAHETLSFQLIVQAPMDAGTYTLKIGGIEFQLQASGRRARQGEYQSPFYTKSTLLVSPIVKKTIRPSLPSRIRPQSRLSLAKQSTSSMPQTSVASTSSIRILLSTDDMPTLRFHGESLANDTVVHGSTELGVKHEGDNCILTYQGRDFLTSPMIRMRAKEAQGTITVSRVKSTDRPYAGTLECRVLNGKAVLINDLPLETYMEGLGEEPDTEPYEKQRAFAIAARTYAAYYMQAEGTKRKFSDMPFDGSDDPAIFQVYRGADFAKQNPLWVRAVRSTANEILMYKGELIKPPYFSSDDGRTRAPSEAGWKSFPFAEIFSPKDDPWCKGMQLRGHGVGMSGCGALGQAKEGKSAEQILLYYYPGVRIVDFLNKKN